MKTHFYLVVSNKGNVRLYKSAPRVAYNEVSIKQSLEVPDGVFRKPIFSATVVVPEEAVTPAEITADVALNAKNAIEQATGLVVRLIVGKEDVEE